jgi:hypothetical protein
MMHITRSSIMKPPARIENRVRDWLDAISRTALTVRVAVKSAARLTVFFLKVFPMLPSQPIDWLTDEPVVEQVAYPSHGGQSHGQLYRPAKGGLHPGILVCLGVVPFGVDHPQVDVLGKALARAGFAALLYWSPSMRDFRLEPDDIENIALAYRWLIEQPLIDAGRSGLLGTCVGGSFAIMAAASPLIRDCVTFLSAYAPYSSMWTFVRDIASESITNDDGTQPWQVDPLTRKVFIHSITAWLAPDEAARLRSAFTHEKGMPNTDNLSPDGKAVYTLLTAQSASDAEAALHQLPLSMQQNLSAMSPMNYLKDLQVPSIQLLHDTGDLVIPIGESLRLRTGLGSHTGVDFTEMQFQHLDPVKGKLPFFRLLREFGKFLRAMYPLFRQTVSA